MAVRVFISHSSKDKPAVETLATALAERLTAAEPDRADYQRDLVVSLVKSADMAGAGEAATLLSRALSIVRELEAGGRLAPTDAWMLGELEQRLRGDG